MRPIQRGILRKRFAIGNAWTSKAWHNEEIARDNHYHSLSSRKQRFTIRTSPAFQFIYSFLVPTAPPLANTACVRFVLSLHLVYVPNYSRASSYIRCGNRKTRMGMKTMQALPYTPQTAATLGHAFREVIVLRGIRFS
jgi:hypothetical protein